MAFGMAANAVDDYLRMSARTAQQSMYNFCEYIIELYGDIYLRKPTLNNVEELNAAHEELNVAHHVEHGLPGMLGSIDCTHWDWENYPNVWK